MSVQAYQQYQRTQTETASPGELVVMPFASKSASDGVQRARSRCAISWRMPVSDPPTTPPVLASTKRMRRAGRAIAASHTPSPGFGGRRER